MEKTKEKIIKGSSIEGIILESDTRISEYSGLLFTDIVVKTEDQRISMSIKGSQPTMVNDLIKVIYDQLPETKYVKYYAILDPDNPKKIIHECADCGM